MHGEDTVGPLIQELTARREHAAASAVASMSLDLMIDHPARKLVDPRSAVRLLLTLEEAGLDDDKARPAAKLLQRAFERWVTSKGEDRPTFDSATENRWRWAQQLARLPDDFPATVLRPLVKAASRGDLKTAAAEVETGLGGDKEAGKLARVHLARHAPELLRVVHEVLPQAPRKTLAVESVSLETWTIPRWGLPVFLLLAVAGVASYMFVTFDEYGEEMEPALAAARTTVCATLGEHTRPCVWSTIVARGLSEPNCGLAKKAMPHLRNEMAKVDDAPGVTASAAEIAGLAPQIEIFAASFKEKCHR